MLMTRKLAAVLLLENASPRKITSKRKKRRAMKVRHKLNQTKTNLPKTKTKLLPKSKRI